MKTWPLRWQIAGWSALATAVALLTFGAIVAYNLYAEQVEMIDNRLAATANLVASRASSGELDLRTLEALAKPPAHRRQAQASLFGFAVVELKRQRIIQAQPSLLAGEATSWPKGRRFINRTLDHTRLRLGAFSVGDTRLVLAASLEPADESVRDLLGAALIAIPIVLLVVAGGSWWIARRALRPIADITQAAAAINSTSLAARLSPRDTDDEIGAHIRVLNEMFDRLQRSFEQTTRFTADAAHELRTPLTILRGQIEDALRVNGLPAPQETLLVGLLDETIGLQKIAENLLLLARFDTGKSNLEHQPVNLSTLLNEAAEDAELLAAPQGIVVDAKIEPDVFVNGDAVMLRRVALNLIDNGIKFNRPAGTLRLAMTTDGGSAIFRIQNTGVGIPAKRRAGLFERFFRSDSDRNREAGGSGLGLSLCREIVLAHGGTIELTQSEADRTEFTVFLPRAST